jgi:hypothetical protein
MTMSLNDISSIANLLAAIGVLITLIYLSRQVRQGNILARYQARQRMIEQAQEELYYWATHPGLRASFRKLETLSPDEQEEMHYFLLAAMRQREWEWFQFSDGVIKKEVYEAYHEVIALHLGIARTRRWWQSVGRIGFNPQFVAEVDALLAKRPTTNYFELINAFDATNTDASTAPKRSASAPQ